jgi:hypothetical protein
MKLRCDQLLSGFAFKFNLRRYTEGKQSLGQLYNGRGVQVEPMKPMLKPRVTKRLKLIYGEPLSKSAFKFNLRRYTTACATSTCASLPT